MQPGISTPPGRTRHVKRVAGAATAVALALAATLAGATSAQAWGGPPQPVLAPNTHFTMAADGSSGATAGGEGIPNVDVDKKTIATYYGDPGTGSPTNPPRRTSARWRPSLPPRPRRLKSGYDAAVAKGEKPAIVFDADDTTLWTYDMEVADMHFTFNPAEQDVWVQDQRFPATPSMVSFVNTAAAMGYSVFGLTGRNDNQKAATSATSPRWATRRSPPTTSTRSGRGWERLCSRRTSPVPPHPAPQSNTRHSPASTSKASATRSR